MDLVFVCELDGFQHASGPFILKRAVLIPVLGGTPHTYTFQTDFLDDEPPAAQQTFRYATRTLHGLPMNLPGITYDNRGDVITSYLKQRIYNFQEKTGDYSANQPTVHVLCKGEQKCSYLRNLIPALDTLQNLEIQNIEDYGCPTAFSLIGCRSSTGARAAVFAAWFRGKFADSVSSTPNSLAVAF